MRASSVISRKLWQFSHNLSRKNIRDLAEHLVLEWKQQKSKYQVYIYNWSKYHFHIFAKLQKSEILTVCIQSDKYIYENLKKINIFWIFTFLLRELHLRSQENFWQFSNYLSRKNIWDLAEHLVLVPKHQKSKTPSICIKLA